MDTNKQTNRQTNKQTDKPNLYIDEGITVKSMLQGELIVNVNPVQAEISWVERPSTGRHCMVDDNLIQEYPVNKQGKREFSLK